MNNSQLFPLIAALSKGGGGGGGSYSTDDFLDNYNADDSNVTAEKDANDKLILTAAGGTGAVDSVNGQTGDVVLDANDILADNSTSIQANLERIDTETERLEDEKQNLIESVEITDVPTSATSGTLTEEQLATLQADKENVIVFNNEIYKLNDNGHDAGSLGYSHSGVENGVFMLKNITVTISTRGWVLSTQEVVEPSGATWGSITGTLSSQTDLQDALDGKQDELTAGTGISIANNVISATGGGGGGGVRVLTAADMNFPASNPSVIALWALDSGVYTYTDSTLSVLYGSGLNQKATPKTLYIVGNDTTSSGEKTSIIGIGKDEFTGRFSGNSYSVVNSTGLISYPSDKILTSGTIVDTLTSTSYTQPLSARQGKALKDLIDALDARVAALEGNA